MPSSARMTDMWSGICCCHSSPTCIPMGGWIISASGDTMSGSLGQGRIGDMTVGFCGHTGQIVTGAATTNANGRAEARLGDQVTGCNIGNIITGMPTHIVG